MGIALCHCAMGLEEAGMQPFERNGNIVVCNGELYGFRNQKAKLIEAGYSFQSDSDCEIILPMYELYGRKCFRCWTRNSP